MNPITSAKEYDITKPDSERQTALHYAAFIGNPEVCRALIRHGSQVDPKDQDGFTPLHRACAADRNEAVDILIEVSIQNLSYSGHFKQRNLFSTRSNKGILFFLH